MSITHGWTSAATPDGSDVTPTNMNDHTVASDTITEAMLSISDNTTKDVSTAAHGFAPKGDGTTTKFLNANGAYSTPAGWPPPFPAAPTLVESVAFNWNVGAGSSTLTLASTPQTGDVLVLVQTHNQYDPTPATGGGATWTFVDFFIDSEGGAIMPIAMWVGVVGGSPSTSVVANWGGGNAGGCSVANFRGLSGVIEASAISGNYQSASTTGLRSIKPLLPILSPLCVAVAFSRSTSAIGSIGGGFTSMRSVSGSNPGSGDFVYKFTTQLQNAAPSWSSIPSASFGIISALIY